MAQPDKPSQTPEGALSRAQAAQRCAELQLQTAQIRVKIWQCYGHGAKALAVPWAKLLAAAAGWVLAAWLKFHG